MRKLLALTLTSWLAVTAQAEETAPVLNDRSGEAPIVSPNIERANVPVPKVEPEQFEVIGVLGLFQADGFSSDFMYGLRGAYHWNKKLFFEAGYVQAKINEEPRENLGIPNAFEDDKLSFFDLGVGYNVLSGRSFFGRHYAVSTDFYAVCDIGKTKLDSNSEWTVSPGIGLRLTPSKWYTLHLDFKGHFVAGDLSDKSDKLKNNLELSLGVGTYF